MLVEINIMCNKCSGYLDGEVMDGTLFIKPCERCLEEVYIEGGKDAIHEAYAATSNDKECLT